LDPLRRVHLRLVPTTAIHPHEIADPFRTQRIERRLRADTVLRDPLVVATVPDIEGYVLLDGTNRLSALVALDLPLALIQPIDYADPHAIELRTWCHGVRTPLDDLLVEVSAVKGLTQSEISPLEAAGVLRESDTFALILDRRRQYAIKRTDPNISRADQLRQVVLGYEDRMVRLDYDPDEVEQRAQLLGRTPGDPTTLVAFPPFTRAQVVAAAMRAAFIPSGITRHIVLLGRALRVNLPLGFLTSGDDLDEANRRLQAHLGALHPRSYEEPTILFDS
jgi:hypothetical protein